MSNAKFTPNMPHFLKPLLPGFHKQLSIPLSFFIKYLKGQNCERAVLRTCGSRTWSVKLKGRRFEDGWEEFARDHDLYVGDVLVFRHGGNMVFDVMVFDTRSACQREYPLFAMKGKDQKKSSAKRFGKQLEKCTSTSFKHEHPYFVATLKPNNLKVSKLNIPRKFARSNGLTDRFCEMVLVDQQGRSWIANLRHKKSDGQVYIGRGWRNLCIANNLKEEDSVLLELIGNGKKPIFKLEVARDSSAKTKPNHPDSKAGNWSCFCEGSSRC
ncbi:B3 DNA binding domain - like 10 [Theobroma cacao]|nr:B3 DNA binding domain - like 10 [Theobroma cacao]